MLIHIFTHQKSKTNVKMTSLSTRLPNEDNPGFADRNAEPNEPAKSSQGKLPMIKELFIHQTRINALKRYLLRIIALIVVAATAVGIYELLGKVT